MAECRNQLTKSLCFHSCPSGTIPTGFQHTVSHPWLLGFINNTVHDWNVPGAPPERLHQLACPGLTHPLTAQPRGEGNVGPSGLWVLEAAARHLSRTWTGPICVEPSD